VKIWGLLKRRDENPYRLRRKAENQGKWGYIYIYMYNPRAVLSNEGLFTEPNVAIG
jgi:hypothetical protein